MTDAEILSDTGEWLAFREEVKDRKRGKTTFKLEVKACNGKIVFNEDGTCIARGTSTFIETEKPKYIKNIP